MKNGHDKDMLMNVYRKEKTREDEEDLTNKRNLKRKKYFRQ